MQTKSIKPKPIARAEGAVSDNGRKPPLVRQFFRQSLFVLLILMTGTLSACGTEATNQGAPLIVGSLQGVQGRIAFYSKGAIYTINADGSGLTNLTPSDRGARPSWSPDGKRIAFAGGPIERTNIYVMDADGSAITQLSTSGATTPLWSPDGHKISYVPWQRNNEDIYVMKADGSNPLRLTNTGGHWSAWSPEGTRIAYECDKQVCVINVDGSHQLQLTTQGGSTPSWSPDGSQIAFAVEDGIYMMNADGSALRRLTNSLTVEGYPIWSPDGMHIAFVGKPRDLLEPNDPSGYGLYIMRADGSAITRLTKRQDVEVTGKPAWSPDGSSIAFTAWARKRDGSKAIYIVRKDGSALAQLVEEGEDPVWQPRP